MAPVVARTRTSRSPPNQYSKTSAALATAASSAILPDANAAARAVESPGARAREDVDGAARRMRDVFVNRVIVVVLKMLFAEFETNNSLVYW